MSKHAQRGRRRESLLIRGVSGVLVLLVVATAVWQIGWGSVDVRPADATITRTPSAAQAPPAQQELAGSVLSVDPRALARAASRVSRKAARLAKPQRVVQAPTLRREPQPEDLPLSFVVGTLNVLGSNHTDGHHKWARGVIRTARQAAYIESHGIDLIGFQEMQPDQIGVLQRQLTGYTIWPGLALGGNGYRLQIAWRSSMFEAVDQGTIPTVFSGMIRPLPWVKLHSLSTGRDFYVVDLHNSPRGMQDERVRATTSEIGLYQQLLATGLPVITMGDTNEPGGFFCRVAPVTGMSAINGASVAGGGCSVPRGSGIDYVMAGTRTGSVSFTSYARNPMPGMSDHPIVFGGITLNP